MVSAGSFLKAADPQPLAEWYQEKPGINFNNTVYPIFPLSVENGKTMPGYNVFSFFPADTKYFRPSKSPVMVNLRVEGLEELMSELKARGVEIVGEMVEEEYGKFGWILDGEGKKVELWEPPDTAGV